VFLVLRPDLVIVAASDAYLRATMTEREAIVGRHLFDVFPDNPDDPRRRRAQSPRVARSRTSTHAPGHDGLPEVRHPTPRIRGRRLRGTILEPAQLPVLNPDGSLACIIHRVEDVTEFVRLSRLEAERTASRTS
jgi:hypothetical protein